MPSNSVPVAFLNALVAEAVVLDGQGVIIGHNDRWRTSAILSGWWNGEAGLGSNYLERCRSADGPLAERFAAAAVGIGLVLQGADECFELDYSYPLAEGLRHYRLTATPLLAGGAVEGVLVLHADLSWSREAEHALLRSEARFATLASEVPVGIFQSDAAGACLYVNRRWCEMTGLTEEEALGHGWADALHPDDRGWLFDAWSYHALTGEPFHLEYRYRRRDGRDVWVAGSATPLRDGTGTTIGYLGSVTDITARRVVEATLREAHAHLEAIVQACPLAIVELDGSGAVASWSPAAERLFGWRAEEVIGTILPIVPQEKRDEFEGLLAQVSSATPITDFETYRQRRDGSRVEVSFSVAAVDGTLHRGERYIGIFTDIAPRKQIERELEQSRELLREAQKLEAVGRLAGGIAHDFNNLLTSILVHTHLLTDHASGEMCEMVHEIRRSAERAAQLTGQLLAFGRKQILQPEIVDLAELVHSLHTMAKGLLGEHRTLVVDLAKEPVRVWADRGQLEQVIVNLLINARDAMPDGGTLTLGVEERLLSDREAKRHELTRDGPVAALIVRDTGIGMSAETRGRLFEPFFTTKPVGQGTGLGLATSHGIIRQSGGNIAVESSVGHGSTFTILLPLERRAVTRQSTSAPCSAQVVRPATILVVDDDESVRRPLRRALERWGYTVLTAADGVEALRVIELASVSPDLILTDVVMPEMNGAQLAAVLVKSHPHVPVLFMSGYSDSEVLRHGVEVGGMRLIRKPFSLHDLGRSIDQALASTRARAAS